MALMTVAMTVIPLMDAFGKLLSTEHDVPPATIALGRFGGQIVWLVLLVVVLTPTGRRTPLRPTRPRVHLLRGVLHGGSSLLFFVALTSMPLADAIAVFFVEPMILIALSAMVLREEVGWPRRIAAAIGFAGALLVIQPSYELFGPVSLLPLGTAFLFAVYLLVTRRHGGDDHAVTIQLWSASGAILLTVPVLILGTAIGLDDLSFRLPDSTTGWLLMAGVGLISTVAHLLVVVAFRLAEASVLAPFNYLEIVTATTFGYLVFGDFPGGLQWVGISIIVATGVFIFWRERQLERRTAPTIRPLAVDA